MFGAFCIKALAIGREWFILFAVTVLQSYGMQQQREKKKEATTSREEWTKKKYREKSKPTSIYSELKISHSEVSE